MGNISTRLLPNGSFFLYPIPATHVFYLRQTMSVSTAYCLPSRSWAIWFVNFALQSPGATNSRRPQLPYCKYPCLLYAALTPYQLCSSKVFMILRRVFQLHRSFNRCPIGQDVRLHVWWQTAKDFIFNFIHSLSSASLPIAFTPRVLNRSLMRLAYL